MQELIRENVNHVVLKADDLQLRFYSQFGGTSLEWWHYGFPGPLTDPFPGAGTSVCWEVGQDPTQASANGLLPHPIMQIGNPITFRYAYYCRETLFDPANCRYEVTGFAPDFWASLERIDDYYPMTDLCWATAYNPKGILLNSPLVPVAFKPEQGRTASVILVGNEMAAGQYRHYRMFAGSCLVSFATCPDTAAEAGIQFRGYATGYRFIVTRTKWKLIKLRAGWFGLDATILSGSLSSAQRTTLRQWGLTLEVRSNNYIPALIELYIDGQVVGATQDIYFYNGPEAGLYAKARSGYILFGNRAFFDVATEFMARYEALPDGVIRGSYAVRPAPWADASPRVFWRAGVGLWMNTKIFPERGIGVFDANGKYLPMLGALNVPFGVYKRAWAGHNDGSSGISAEVKSVKIDGVESTSGHFSIQQHGAGDSHVLLISPLMADTTRSLTSCEWVMEYRCKHGNIR